MFIQVIQGRCSDADRLRKQLDVWERDLASGADGFLGSTGGLTDDGTFVAVVRFESREQADAQSSRPEQDAWWQETSTCYDGEVDFRNYDDAFTMLDGGSDDAGFVQVMQGRVDDAAGFRSFIVSPCSASIHPAAHRALPRSAQTVISLARARSSQRRPSRRWPFIQKKRRSAASSRAP